VALIAALLSGAVALPAQARAEVSLLPDCGNVSYGGKVEPVQWSSGCLGGSVNLDQLRWKDWGAPAAVATGIVRYNTCEPDCAGGSVYDYPAELRTESIKQCASPLGPQRYYTRFTITVTFPEGNDAGQPAGTSPPFSFTASCPYPGYLVSTGSKAAGFGAFVESGEYDGSRLDLFFGPSSSKRPGRYSMCTKRWPKLGMTVKLVLYGVDGDPCEQGGFFSATLDDGRWHTSSGVRPGGSVSRAARASVRRCTRATCNNKTGYVLALHRIDCAPGLFPGVIAETARGRVKRLVIQTYSCE